MKYVVYGVNRVAKDFIYMFPQLDIMAFFEDGITEGQFMDKPVYPLKNLLIHCDLYDQIIICDFDKTERKNRLEKLGLIYGKDFIFEQDFFPQLDEIKINPQNKPYLVWGTGLRAKKFVDLNKNYDIQFFVDTYNEDKIFEGRDIKKPVEIKNWNDYFVIIGVMDDLDIRKYLDDKGMHEKTDYINSLDIVMLPSNMLERTIFDQSHYDFECRTMLNHAELSPNGYIYCCCSTIIENGIGDINFGGLGKVWKSYVHKVMCLSSENRTYTFCKKNMCPFFIGKEQKQAVVMDGFYHQMEEYPRVTAIGFDPSCNLKCETCRDDIIVSKGDKLKESLRYAEIVKKEILPYSRFFILAGDGEVFVSQAYKEIYQSQEMNDVGFIRILSNGTLFNEKNWKEFRKNKKGKIMLTVSIDAATKETYEMIRRGGNFDILKENMKFASELRKAGDLNYFRMNFVVQRKNYMEIIPFIKWGLELDADEVFFTKVLNWGTFTKEEFKEISMMEEDGYTPKAELREILNHPIINNKIVDLGTIRYAHNPVIEDEIENYYMWELERKVPGLFSE